MKLATVTLLSFAHLLGVAGKAGAQAPAEPVEDFWYLLRNLAHWEFELFLMLVVDVLIGALAWPAFLRWHHRHEVTQHPQHEREILILGLSNAQQRIEALEARAARHTQEDE